MTESVTQNYHWTKPEVTKSASTWGGFLNTDLDSIDALVFANQQGVVPVGAVTMFAGATAPANWLICDGRSLDTTAYAALFAVLQYAHGGSGANFNLPNLKGAFPLGAGASNPVGQAGGSNSYTLDVAHLPPHAHSISDPGHTHSAFQSAHTHTIVTGNHSHVITTGAHNHTVNNTIATSGSGLTNGGAQWSLGTQTTTTAGNLGGNTDTAGNLGGITDTQAPGIGVNGAYIGISTTQNAGSGAAMNIVPQYVALNFIIRFS